MRVFVSETNQLRRGLLYHVPHSQPHYFHTWEELFKLVQEELNKPEDDEGQLFQRPIPKGPLR